jgi:uncharacterized protein YajQ (UPF0234 family)
MENNVFRIVGEGVATAVDFREFDGKKTAKLQFLTRKETGGLELFDVKVEGATDADLAKFVGKMVRLEDLKINTIQKENMRMTYYKIDDISKIRIIGGQK